MAKIQYVRGNLEKLWIDRQKIKQQLFWLLSFYSFHRQFADAASHMSGFDAFVFHDGKLHILSSLDGGKLLTRLTDICIYLQN